MHTSALNGRSAAEKCKFLKRDIVLRMNRALVKASGVETANMEYVQYERKIVQDLGIVLEGWPLEEPLTRPSALGSLLGKLEKLRNALIEGTCNFHKISAKEKAQRYQEWCGRIASGEVIEKLRKEQSDKGMAKGPRVPTDNQDNDDSSSSSDDGNDNDDARPPTSTSSPIVGPPTTAPSANKQRKTASGISKASRCKTKANVTSSGGVNMVLTAPDGNGSSFSVF
ncbi:hypothetical protein FISHEDRAFT_74160 [Fistulina hepatica ATCC 64428]|uniref:Uncharacterized protein n=1 Tax=Fistulina hepatica ATCC 64428 TaxID=1128425 RepID=A0A0D7AC02_9AGAR|nr:hypothetical protein FISHEDRAFT_74160 [Fistulina hepatica ATCC 64428]